MQKTKEDDKIFIFGGKSVDGTMSDIYYFFHSEDDKLHLESDRDILEEKDKFHSNQIVKFNNSLYLLGKHHIHIYI